MRVALYLRVSTAEQSTDSQRHELLAWADRAGHEVVGVYEDHGISGAKGRDKRPSLDRMLRDANRREFDLVAVWSLDRLGRSLKDLVLILDELGSLGVGLYLSKQGLDTSTTWGRAMLQMAGVFAEVEREMIRERVKAGVARAKRQGKRLGRRPQHRHLRDRARELSAKGMSVRAIAKELGIGRGTAHRYVS